MNKREQKAWKQEMECAERLGRRGLKGHVHVKKGKVGNDVCGAAGKEGARTRQKEKNRKWRVRNGGGDRSCTRQKGKSRKWRVRSHPQQRQTTVLYTPKRKKQEMTCAEPPPAVPNYRIAHAKKKKAGNGV